MEKQSSLTALISSFGRVYHAENDSPIIFNDTLSRQLMTDNEYQQIYGYMLGGIDFFAPDKKTDFASADDMIKWIIQMQIAPTPLARARYCEDALKTAIFTGTTQFVILGAGMEYRFLIYEHLCTEEIQKRFFQDRTDYLSAFEHIEYALAVLK